MVGKKQDGLLLNFAGPKPSFERLFNIHQEPLGPASEIHHLHEPAAPYAPDLVGTIRGALFELFKQPGPGFVHHIYANACDHEFTLLGLSPVAPRELTVLYKGSQVSTIKFAHIQVEQSPIFPVATTNPNDLLLPIINAYLAFTGHPLAILANFQDTTLTPTIIRPNP